MPNDILIRRFTELDSVDELTAFLHRAYADHAAEGRIFFASYQSPEATRSRISRGECWITVSGDSIIGTITVTGARNRPDGYPASEKAGSFSQLAVRPDYRGSGLGSRLVQFAEHRIAELGSFQIVIDTSSLATDLIDWYVRRGYSRIGSWKWEVTNYESVVLHKSLVADPSG